MYGFTCTLLDKIRVVLEGPGVTAPRPLSIAMHSDLAQLREGRKC